MSDITDIKDWLEYHLMENENDDNNLCTVKYTEQQQRVKAKKAEEATWRAVVEEATWRAAEEARRRKVEEVAEVATKRQVSLFRDRRRLLADQAGQAGC